MSRQILSIEIRNDGIVAVLLNAGLKMATVDHTATVPLPPPSDDDPEPLVLALTQLKEEIDTASANVVVALPPDKILYRKLSVPFKEDNKIKQILPFELEPLLPVDIGTLKIGFHKNQSLESTDILAVAIDQSALQAYMDALNAANIRPQLIVPGGFPLTRYLSETDEFSTQQLLVLDVEENKTTLFATHSGNIELVRRLSSGVRSEQEAEALALRIRQTLTAMSDHQNEYIVPSKVFITGTGLDTPDAFQRISLALELPTDRLDMGQWAPRLEIGYGAGWIPEKMNSALALALLDIDGRPCANFHRTSSPLRNYWNAYRSYITVPAMLLAIAITIGLLSVISDNVMLNKRVKKLDEQIEQVYLSTFPNSRITAPPLDLMKSKIKELKKGNSSSGQNPSPVRTIDVLLDISKLIPKNIDLMLTQMTVGGDAVTISGETGDFNSVDDIKNNVEKGALFKQVTIASANMDKTGKKVRFKLKINL